MAKRKKNDGGPAFPHLGLLHKEQGQAGYLPVLMAGNGGMSLRAWFAGLAMQGLLCQHQQEPGDMLHADYQREPLRLAKYAVEVSDAMLEALASPDQHKDSKP